MVMGWREKEEEDERSGDDFYFLFLFKGRLMGGYKGTMREEGNENMICIVGI